jgi:hypothetical protein
MGHIKYKSETRAEATDPRWYGVGSQIGQLVNLLSDRSDLIAYVGPGAGGAAPACYTPATAEVEINVDVAFGKNVNPVDIGDIRERDTQFAWPKATGAIFHEALHARYSTWNIAKAADELEQDEFMALILLEEGRIEAFGVGQFPENSGFLRAAALELVLADLSEEFLTESDTQMAARLAALTLARVDAGSLEDSDCASLAETVENKLGTERLEALRQIWLAVQMHSNHYDVSALYPLAREWARIVKDAAEENGDAQQGEGEPGGMSTPGGSSGGPSEFMKDLLDALEEAAGNAVIGAFDQLSEQQEIEQWTKEAKDRASEARQEQEHKEVASDVFGKGTGPMPESETRSTKIVSRDATPAERSAAVKIAQMLDKAKYRERDEIDIKSVLPPGRLRTRAVMQGAALKSKGVMTQTEPWRRTVRKHTDDPTLSIGVMVDISGSMGEAMEPMATTAWVMSEAVRRIQGRAAMVYYGQDVFPTLKPGQHLTQVDVYTAPDGTEKFNKAFKALDGGMNLLHGSGARLLVVVSDGCYTSTERIAAKRWVAECSRNGVGVLWLTFDNGSDVKSITNGTNAVVLTGLSSPELVAMEIGSSAARALSVAQ